MKKVGLFLLALAMTAPAFAGNRIFTCVGTVTETRLDIYENLNGSMIGVVTTESAGGAYPQFKYLVSKVPPGMVDSGTLFTGKHLMLRIPMRGRATLTIDDIGINEIVKCLAK